MPFPGSWEFSLVVKKLCQFGVHIVGRAALPIAKIYYCQLAHQLSHSGNLKDIGN